MTQNTAENATVVIWSRTFKDSVYTTSSGTYFYSLDYDVYDLYAYKWVEETQTLWWFDTVQVDLNTTSIQQDLHMMEVE